MSRNVCCPMSMLNIFDEKIRMIRFACKRFCAEKYCLAESFRILKSTSSSWPRMYITANFKGKLRILSKANQYTLWKACLIVESVLRLEPLILFYAKKFISLSNALYFSYLSSCDSRAKARERERESHSQRNSISLSQEQKTK